MQALWTLVNISQLISLMPLLSIRFPANVMVFFQVLAFINGDIYILTEAYHHSVGRLLAFQHESAPYNHRF